jgi:hypothetical protein
VYDPREIGRNACCVAKHRFIDLFPTLPPVDSEPAAQNQTALTGNVDIVYYSYHFHAVYLFAGELVYELVPSTTPGIPRAGLTAGSAAWAGVRRFAPWYDIWFDICDVE